MFKLMIEKKNIIVIAEAGVNHNGNLDQAMQLIDVAAEANADYVKFQTFKAEKSVTLSAPKADYQESTTGVSESQREMIRRFELDLEAHKTLIKHCHKRGVRFLSTAFDPDSIDMLLSLGMDLFKIPSGEITNLPYLRKIRNCNKPVILSTGMAHLGEVKAALEILMSGKGSHEPVTVLHCNTAYPTPIEDVNLRAMLTLRDDLNVAVGYSDHTLGIEVPIAAVALGAVIIEKHFTLDRNLPGPDHRASLEPDELKSMVAAIRNVEKCMGDGVKQPSASERKNMPIVRKSIVAARAISIGELFAADNLTTKRPGTGISPMCWDSLIGQKATRNYEPDDFIEA